MRSAPPVITTLKAVFGTTVELFVACSRFLSPVVRRDMERRIAEARAALARHGRRPPGRPMGRPGSPVTPTPADIIALAARGVRVARIARHLGISRPTVRRHLRLYRESLAVLAQQENIGRRSTPLQLSSAGLAEATRAALADWTA